MSKSRKLKRPHVETIDDCPVPAKKNEKTPGSKENMYQAARKCLSFNYSTNLPGRESEIAKLHELFKEMNDKGHSGSFYISGPPGNSSSKCHFKAVNNDGIFPGTGKTASLTRLIQSPQLFPKDMKFVYVNCTSISTIGSIYKKISTELKLCPDANTEKAHLSAIEHHLTHKHPRIMLVLDEIDQLAGKKQTILYQIFEWPAISKVSFFGTISCWQLTDYLPQKSNLILVGIANSLDLTDRLLARLQTKCELKPQLLHFAPYTKQQICDILRDRLEKNNSMSLFPPATIQLLAAKVAAVSGDIRKALDIARRVIEISESASGKKQTKTAIIDTISKEILDSSDAAEPHQPVKITEVVNVLNTVYGGQRLDNDMEDAFPLQQKIMICSLLLIIKKDKNKNITVGRLHEVYKKACAKRTIGAVDQSEFASLCNLAETRGIVRVLAKKEPRLSKICLQWDEDEVTSALKDKQLIAEILNDGSSLVK
jgi:cell division control protein 6